MIGEEREILLPIILLRAFGSLPLSLDFSLKPLATAITHDSGRCNV